MIEDVFASLDVAVFERRADGLFEPVGRRPEWLPIFEIPFDLSEAFPLLELFLSECEGQWKGQSDVWTETDTRGGERYLQAVAIPVDGRRFIALRSLPEALYTYQQLAHDFELEKQKVEKLSRELEIKRREAERATQAKSDFLATMSHEIRTPLNAIIGMADVLGGTPLTAEQRKCVDVFQRNGVGLLTLINDILDLSKVEAGKVELEIADLDLREVISRATEVVEGRVRAKGLTLREVIAPEVPAYLRGDPNRLRQILINLLGNSIKFTEQGGLEVRVEPDPDNPTPGHLRFAVADTGIGIPADKLGTIFESFSQADSSTTRKYGGTGLGLTISKQLVELMGGRIWVESQVGVGSVFYFTTRFDVLDALSAAPPAERAAPMRKVEDLEPLLSGLCILLADDSEDNRYLICSYLKDAGVQIDIAENGESAVRMFRCGQYDLVLMDVEMPVMDGYQATREIRQLESETGARATAILALTAHAFAEMAIHGRNAGFTALLTKPIRKVTLLEALAEHAPRDRPLRLPRAVIQVDKGMEDIVPVYLEKRRAEVAVYADALAREDFDSIKSLAHKMRGTGAGYGFPMLTEFGGTIEQAAKSRDAAQVRESLSRFAAYVRNIDLKYSK